MKTFSKTFEIDEVLGWKLYKTNLAEALLDRTTDAPGCPEEISGSVFTVEIEVKDKAFVVTLTEGEES